jgi:ATP-dependent protease Clp ATPase subunit
MTILKCNFCNANFAQVKELIGGSRQETGSSIFICDECVFLCVDILKKKGITKETPASD